MRTPRLANPAREIPNARDAEPWQHRKYQRSQIAAPDALEVDLS
jgi:hypothetical protein